MPDHEIHVPDHSGRVEGTPFQVQIRRLESLQTLMAQGGLVVGEVAQFLARAREEVEALQQDQQSYAATQQHLLEEKARLLDRVDQLEKAALRTDVTVRELEATITKLRAQLDAERLTLGEEARALAARSEGSQLELGAVLEKLSEAEKALQREREMRDRVLARTQHEQTTRHAAEISLLRERLTALEHQLGAERVRRNRLMDVVKTHDVTVAVPAKQRELSA